MSSETEASVKIIGDASGVAPAINETKGEISGLAEAVASMAAQMAEMGETMKGAFVGGAPAAVNRRRTGTPDRRAKGTPLTAMARVDDEGTVRAARGVGRA